ncbi:MAG: molybdopterin molybdochelatase [Chloroflexi bacterium]|jgi:molybdate-binding protein/DNA-binding transcriptional regulator YhcF (GntR family)|nr:molybdopterin molybdochelatase [Chloroflexota bacterium]
MIDIVVSNRSQVPIYKQIAEQVKHLIANNLLKPGQQMPTVRDLSHHLQVNPATVARAYQELEQEGILGASRRRGTIVLGDTDSPQRWPLRQNRLSGTVNNLILEALSLGYTPEELEAAFTLQLARWRIQRETAVIATNTTSTLSQQVIHVVGSNDLALELLVNRLKYNNPELTVQITPAGSLGGLLAIQEGNADMAGIHLLDEETGEYNYPYIKHTLQGIEVAVVHLADRIQGLMVAKGNPKHIMSLEDLKRPDVTFANRQKGSGTRVWLDYKLRGLGILPNSIKGYTRELDTHLAVAMCIVRGEADVALGIQAAANSCNLDFIPATKERFDLVIPLKNYNSQLFTPLLQVIQSEEFKKVVNEMGGYDTAQTGDTAFIK